MRKKWTQSYLKKENKENLQSDKEKKKKYYYSFQASTKMKTFPFSK